MPIPRCAHRIEGTVKLAIITPTFSRDLPLLELSVESVDRHCSADIHHYIVVSRQEERLFRHLKGSRRSVLITEEIASRPIRLLPMLVRGQQLWWSEWRRFVRGWIMQQAIKISAPDITDADVFLFLDTDVFFIRPFNVSDVVKDGRVRLLVSPGMGDLETHRPWHRTAAKLLGLPTRDYFGADFIGHAVTWRRDICLEMRERISSVAGARWFSAITREQHISEYILYGIFVQELLGSSDLRHAPTSEELCLSAWVQSTTEHLVERLRPHHLAVNLQSNLHLPMPEVRNLLNSIIAAAGTNT
jgi:hypothetical protein